MLLGRIKAAVAAAGDPKTRVTAGALVLVVLVPLLTNLLNFVSVLRHPPVTNMAGEVAGHDRRLAALKKALPKRGVVGYVTDAADENEATKRYYMTQYALSPLVVVRGAEGHGLVVGDFEDPSAAGRQGAGLSVREDFGGGVVLFGGEGR